MTGTTVTELPRDPGRPRFGSMLRRSWLVLLTALACAAAAYGFGSLKQLTYTAEALMVVPSGADAGKPGNANDAKQLAATYAGVIEDDTKLLHSVQRKLDVPFTTVEKSVDVVNDTDTGLLRLRYKSADAKEARLAAATMAQQLERGVSSNVPKGSVDLVGFPQRPEADEEDPMAAVPAGAVLGLILGILLLLAWERWDWRIEDGRTLSAEAGAPALALDDQPDAAVRALLDRWTLLIGRVSGEVAVLPGSPRSVGLLGPVVQRLRQVEEQSGLSFQPAFDRHADVAASALAADLTVLVVARGTNAREVRNTVEELARVGVYPGWALLVPKTGILNSAPSPAAASTTPLAELTGK